MKHIKLIFALCAFLALLPISIYAQNQAVIDIKAVVVDGSNEPVKGALVKSKTVDASAITDESGAFSIKVPGNSILEISATGYKTLVVVAAEGLDAVILESDVELVQLAFRKANKGDLMGGVSVLNSSDLIRKSYTTNPIDGMVTELGGFNSNSIWGMGDFLIVVDGIPRDLNDVRTTEIEQITLLKGAGAVALYGTHAANGVLLISTKRGYITEQKVDVRVNTGLNQPKRFPKYLNSYDYITLYTEARINDGILITSREIDSLATFVPGRNTYRYPEMDLYSSEFLRSAYNRSDITTEIYGGDKNARYYTNIGFMRQGSLLNFGEGANGYDQRFNIKGNVDVNLNSWLSAGVDAGAVFSEGRGPRINYWEQAATIRPNQFSPLLPISMIDMSNDTNRFLVENTDFLIDGKYVLSGPKLEMVNPIADVYGAGYNKAIDRQFLFNTNIDADMSSIIPGLAFRTRIGIDYNTNYNQGYRYTYQVLQPKWETVDGLDRITELVPIGTSNKSNEELISNSNYQQLIYFSGQFDYKRTFNDRHNLFSMLVANGYQYSTSGVYQKTTNTNLGYYLGYNYMNRYYADFNSSLMYTTKLAPGNHTALSPVLSLGWRISEEAFMEGVSAVDNLKLTSNIGRIYSDLSIEQHYMYSSIYRYRNTNWYSWAAEMGIDVTSAIRGANPELEAPYRDELSVGVETTLFNRLIDLDANYFSIKNAGGIVLANNFFPNYLQTGWPASSFVPYINYNEERRTGFDFNLRLNRTLGNVDWIFGLAGTFYDTEVLKRGEVYKYTYQEREGRPIDAVWGLQSAGFFADKQDILNSPKQFGNLMPGDIKYVDQNNDGVITNEDEIYLGKGGWFGAPNTLGVNVTAKWKNFTFFAQGVGQWGSYGIKNRTTDWVFGQRKYSDVVKNRWANYTHPVTGEVVDTRATATYPRLTTDNGDNNFRVSDFWYINTNRFDISRIQLTYQLPQTLLGSSFVKNIEVYLAGSNLITIAPEREYLETNVGQAPQMRFYNFGITAAF